MCCHYEVPTPDMVPPSRRTSAHANPMPVPACPGKWRGEKGQKSMVVLVSMLRLLPAISKIAKPSFVRARQMRRELPVEIFDGVVDQLKICSSARRSLTRFGSGSSESGVGLGGLMRDRRHVPAISSLVSIRTGSNSRRPGG
jgi:hypothetical protein